ncbi:type IV toxin-antitoxin system AbiEi family antitoxin domain-containing protein [Pseudonocardia sp. C8]|uniref:type IV toxin-antitoxin system AbiEi family antitoxin domain-containing protein n=1 Tax=Pseudonocardia sp. C8 TaxID=2762759 RepID=UPI0016426CB9|nr:type IV toxin-antitoxin system AbiEi family antitoxin domain-containing protein [Pseudonocardia sp. C8]MBC3191637.1 type IV toxin-antitoxin system AbiEi family antitoxin domain-containing protein [Pseudonocardia sp. C8]
MDLTSLLRAQGGVVTTAQAERCGVAPRTLRRWVREGRWNTPYPGIYRDGSHRFGPRARIRAVALWGGESGTVAGPAAAWWYGLLDCAPAIVTLILPRTTSRRPRRGVCVRRRDLEAADRAVHDGIALTARPLTVLEAATAIPDGAAFLDRALQRRWVTFDAVYAAWCRACGATGSAQVRRLLVAAADRAASEAERRLVRLLRDAGIGGWELGYRFGPYELDLAFPAARVAVEFDGWAWHTDVARFRNDRRKGNELVLAGWTLLRVTWHDLETAPGRVLAQIRHALGNGR